MSYKPYTLPKLPRQQCPFECMDAEALYPSRRNGPEIIKSRTCDEHARANGWCRDHGYVVEVLEMADAFGYPALAVNEHLLIGKGVADWEGVAQRISLDRAIEIKMALIEMHEEMPLNDSVIRGNGHVRI